MSAHTIGGGSYLAASEALLQCRAWVAEVDCLSRDWIDGVLTDRKAKSMAIYRLKVGENLRVPRKSPSSQLARMFKAESIADDVGRAWNDLSTLYSLLVKLTAEPLQVILDDPVRFREHLLRSEAAARDLSALDLRRDAVFYQAATRVIGSDRAN